MKRRDIEGRGTVAEGVQTVGGHSVCVCMRGVRARVYVFTIILC